MSSAQRRTTPMTSVQQAYGRSVLLSSVHSFLFEALSLRHMKFSEGLKKETYDVHMLHTNPLMIATLGEQKEQYIAQLYHMHLVESTLSNRSSVFSSNQRHSRDISAHEGSVPPESEKLFQSTQHPSLGSLYVFGALAGGGPVLKLCSDTTCIKTPGAKQNVVTLTKRTDRMRADTIDAKTLITTDAACTSISRGL